MVYTDGTAMVADTIEELEIFAHKCGLFVFNDHRRRPHYTVDKATLPTVLAHGAKRVSPLRMNGLANAMAKKREHWYEGATDDAIMDKVKKYAPYFQGHEIPYLGQIMTADEMFVLTSEMFKDLRDGKPVTGFKLPKVLPLNPRRDPPTDSEVLADLKNKIDMGVDLLKDEDTKEEKDEKRVEDITRRMGELQAQFDELQQKITFKALRDLEKSMDDAKALVESFEVGAADSKDALKNFTMLKGKYEKIKTDFPLSFEEYSRRKALRDTPAPIYPGPDILVPLKEEDL